jgi:serine protease
MGGMSRRPLATLALVILAAVVFAPFAGATSGGVPNDPLFTAQWGLTMVGAPQAWATSTGRGITIGIVDTGVDLTHQDLAAHILASTDCVGSDGDPTQCHGTGQDDNGHGTHIAGIANAVTNNNIGVAGMAPDARLVVAKALDSAGSGSVADINAAIEWVVDHGAEVVNLSLGDSDMLFTSQFGASLAQGIEYAWSRGAIPVLAAGNSGVLGLGGSSNYGNLDAVVVGAVGRAGTLATYSSPTGTAKWALLAPGGSADGIQADDIVSTYWVSGETNQYAYLSGTSIAASFVSGTLALLLAAGLTPTQAVNRLLANVNTLVSCGTASVNCHGLLNAAAAVAGLPPAGSASGAGPGTTATTVTPATTPVVSVAPGPTTTVPVSPSPPSPAPHGTVPPVQPTVHAAPPAVMLPTQSPVSHPPSSSPPRKSGTVAAESPTTTTLPAGTTGKRILVGLPTVARHHSGSSSVAWFALLAAGFAALVAFGIVQVMRAVPDVDS